jgi:tetratricopeptide (TPR) repeat protein
MLKPILAMLKQLFSFSFLALSTFSLSAQNLTPEQEKLKAKIKSDAEAKLNKLVENHNLPVQTIALNDGKLELPKADPKLLAQIPKQPLSYEQLSLRLDQFSVNLKAKVNTGVVKEVEAFIARQTDSTKAVMLEGAALQSYINGNLSASLLFQTAAAKADRYRDPYYLINLAGYFNLAGYPHASVTVMDCLNKENKQAVDTSATAQNNYGHALVSLGKIEEGKQHYQNCLSLDSLAPEALSATAMLFWQGGKWQEAIANFKKALCVRYSPSDIACVKKIAQQQGKDLFELINLYEIFKTKSRYYGEEEKNIHAEIGLESIVSRMPPAPQSLKGEIGLRPVFSRYLTSLQAESMRFMQNSTFSPAEAAEEAKRESSPAKHNRWVEVRDAADHLQKSYSDKLTLTNEEDTKEMIDLFNQQFRERVIAEASCPKAPVIVGIDQDWEKVQMAYDEKCCGIVRPIVDRFINSKNNFYKNKFNKVASNWKQYIDGLAMIYSKDPTTARQKQLNGAVAGFLNVVMIHGGQLAGNYEPLPYCHEKMSKEEADMHIALAEASLKCRQPKIKANFGILSGSMENCDKIGLELDLGVNIKYEQYVSTGQASLFLGAKGKIDKFTKGFIKAGWTAGAVIGFDKTGFTDFGVKGDVGAGVTFKKGNSEAKKTLEFAPEAKLEGMVTIRSGFSGKFSVPMLEPIKF